MMLLGYSLSNEAKGNPTQTLADYLREEDGITNVIEKENIVIVTYKGIQYSINKATLAAGSYQTQGLASDKESQVVEKLKNTSVAMTVEYTPTANAEASIVIPSENNGGVAEQTFTQASVGSQTRQWYVLSTDDEGVNLVSTVTAQNVKFKDSAGYDNCLYYLDKIAKDLFTNEETYGVTRNRVHALNLTDIKKATEQMNSRTKVGERDWSWETDFLESSLLKANTDKTMFRGTADYTNSYYTYHPTIYKADESGVVTCNNPLYDEKVIANPITTDSGIKRNETYNPASKLTVNNTCFYFNSRPDNLTALGKGTTGTFGNSKLADTLFNGDNGDFWLSTRLVEAFSNGANYGLHVVLYGRFYFSLLGVSYGEPQSSSWGYPLRVVVSVPGSHVSVDENGVVSLK